MKIVFIGLLLFDKIGGIQTCNKYFINALRDNGYDYTAISLHDKSLNNSEHLVCCNSNKFFFILQLIKHCSHETVVFWSHVNFYPLLFLKRIFQYGKTINICLAYGTEFWKKRPGVIKKTGVRLFDYVLSISEYTKNKITQLYDFDKEHNIVFPCCIEPIARKEEKSPYQEGYNILTILRLDGSEKLKAVTHIMRALQQMPNDKEIYFTVIGSGQKLEELKGQAKKYNVENRIRFLGFVENVSPYLMHCDCFSLLSNLEGFGIVYLEAMQFKKPCLASNNCGSTDVVINGFNGYSVEVDDIDAIVDAIMKLMMDKQRSAILGENGYKHFQEHFTYAKFKINQHNTIDLIVGR
jgi:glycosyltransferase involved in cell wall biosynthesis